VNSTITYSYTADLLDIRQLSQSTLDSSVVKAPQFTSEGLMEHIGELLVSDHNAVLLVEKRPFRRIFKFVRPTLNDSDIPHRGEARKWILDKMEVVISRLREIFSVRKHQIKHTAHAHSFQDLKSLVSLTIDTWTDKEGLNFMSVTGHYIDAPKDSPQDWELHSVQLGLPRVEGRHTGNNLAQILVRVIDQYGMRDKVRYLCSIPVIQY
jgi:hypothetical protein